MAQKINQLISYELAYAEFNHAKDITTFAKKYNIPIANVQEMTFDQKDRAPERIQ